MRAGRELQRSWVPTWYELQRNWVTSRSVTGFTNWIRTGNGPSKSTATKPILSLRGQGGESVAGKTKGGSCRGFEEKQFRDRRRRRGQGALFSFSGFVAGNGKFPQLKRPLCPRRAVSLAKADFWFGFFCSLGCCGGSYCTSVVSCLLTPAHGHAPALFFFWLWLTRGKEAARHSVGG